jgi:hypothetical protein
LRVSDLYFDDEVGVVIHLHAQRLTRKVRAGRSASRHPAPRKLVRFAHSGPGFQRLNSPMVPSSAASTGSGMSPVALFTATQLARF